MLLTQHALIILANIGFIARPDSVNTNSFNIAGNFRIVSEGSSIVGDSANKVGNTTGWTQGEVTKTCVNTGVFGTKIILLCQTFVNAGVLSGDSGSPVFNITNNPEQYDVHLLGILWGSSGETLFVYSPMTNIEYELGQINTSTYNYTHTLTTSSGSPFDSVTDTVTSTIGSFYGNRATFDWIRPDGSIALISDVPLLSNQYENFMTPDMEGFWNIETIEYDNSHNIVFNGNNPSQTSFTAMGEPEFGSLGLVIPLFLAGIFYLQLRRKIL